MIWVTWRQQRMETLIALGVVALLAAILVPTGLDLHAAYHREGLAACIGHADEGCGGAIGSFFDRFGQLGGLFDWLAFVPGIIGVLLAAPFVLELEQGTYRLAWTQSVTRRQWLVRKLALIVAASLLAALALTLLLTWWRSPLDKLQGRMQANVFSYEGVVPYTYILFAVGLTLAVGAVLRRTAPAAILGLVGYTVLRLFVQLNLRQHFRAPLTATWARGTGPNMQTAWVLNQYPSDRFGHPATNNFDLLQLCGSSSKKILRLNASCMQAHGAGFNHAVYQPASRFWLFQGMEASIFGVLAVALILFAAWWVHERTT